MAHDITRSISFHTLPDSPTSFPNFFSHRGNHHTTGAVHPTPHTTTGTGTEGKCGSDAAGACGNGKPSECVVRIS